MCTVSWLPGAGGYTLCFNRDERFTRSPALPPAPHTRDGMAFLAPLDGDFHGTWLAVNAAGVTVCLLNRYQVPGYQPPARPRSRGLLVLDLIAAGSVRELWRMLEGTDLGQTAPFTLAALEPATVPRVAVWDGATLAGGPRPAPGFLFTSSSVTEPEVAASREATFAAVTAPTPEDLVRLHRSHLPERGRRSVCMHRDDGETQCFSQVTVTEDRVTLLHVPDAPCRGVPLPPLSLERRALPCPATE